MISEIKNLIQQSAKSLMRNNGMDIFGVKWTLFSVSIDE
jgi:hypothetical protein